MLDWLIWQMPWWVQAGLLALFVGVPVLLVAFMVWGPRAVLRAALPVLGAVVTLGLASKLRQEGYRAREAQEDEVRRKAEEIAARERDEARRLPDDKLDEEVDRWTRS
jgi:hypothetical protein